MLLLICLCFPYAGFSRPTFYHFKKPKKSPRTGTLLSPFTVVISYQNFSPRFSTRAAWNALSIVRGTAVVFTDVQFKATSLPGAGIIPAGLLEKELRIISKSDPDSHMNRLRTGCLGCCAVRRRESVLLHRPKASPESLTAWYHNYPSRRHGSIE